MAENNEKMANFPADGDEFDEGAAGDLVDFEGNGEAEMFQGDADLGDDLNADFANGEFVQENAGMDRGYAPPSDDEFGGHQQQSPSAPAESSPGLGEAAENSKANPLAEFNARFREQVEQKDAEERKLKQQRRDEAAEQLKTWFDKRVSNLDKRKEQNRIDQEDTRNEITAAMGNSWTGVASLIDVTNTEAGDQDVSRMKDVLVQLKNNPPAEVTSQ